MIVVVKQIGVMKQKIGQIWNKKPPLVICHRKHNIVIGMPGLTAYSKNISCLAETMKHET